MAAWTRLESLPYKYFSKPLPINKYEYIVVPAKDGRYTTDGIYKYNVIQNLWTKILSYNKSFKSTFHSVAISDDKQFVYICNCQSQLIQFDLKTNENIILSNQANFGIVPRILCIGNDIHIIGGGSNNKHFIFNVMTKTYTKIYKFPEGMNKMYGHNIIFMRQRQSIILIAAESLSVIYEYSLDSKLWKRWNNTYNKLPLHLFFSSCCYTLNEKYILIIGGSNNRTGKPWTNNITIYNLETNQFKLSHIKAPSNNPLHCIILSDTEKDEILVNGYVNSKILSYDKRKMIQRCPQYLLQMIANWVCMDILYVLDYGLNGNGDQWMIKMDDIIMSTK